MLSLLVFTHLTYVVNKIPCFHISMTLFIHSFIFPRKDGQQAFVTREFLSQDLTAGLERTKEKLETLHDLTDTTTLTIIRDASSSDRRQDNRSSAQCGPTKDPSLLAERSCQRKYRANDRGTTPGRERISTMATTNPSTTEAGQGDCGTPERQAKSLDKHNLFRRTCSSAALQY